MRRCARQRLERPFPCQRHDAHDQIDDLEDGNGFDGAVEAVCDEIPEDFGPEEAFYRGADLPCARELDVAEEKNVQGKTHRLQPPG